MDLVCAPMLALPWQDPNGNVCMPNWFKFAQFPSTTIYNIWESFNCLTSLKSTHFPFRACNWNFSEQCLCSHFLPDPRIWGTAEDISHWRVVLWPCWTHFKIILSKFLKSFFLHWHKIPPNFFVVSGCRSRLSVRSFSWLSASISISSPPDLRFSIFFLV